jgi:bifunctional enzyme CysN/CysC
MLDGDNVRYGLNRDLGFIEVDRVENIRRIGEVADDRRQPCRALLVHFVVPRRMVRDLMAEGEFIEVFVDTPLAERIARDPKGLYRRALAGETKSFTAVSQAYETPVRQGLRLMAGEAAA